MRGYRAVRVWDGLVRATHWLNAACVPVLLALGAVIWQQKALHLEQATLAALVDAHAAVGFAFAASLSIRIAYALAGPEGPAHWRDIVPHTAAQMRLAWRTLRYYASGFRGECPLYFAHNPLAGIAYTAFFALGALQSLTGAAMYLQGPVAPTTGDDWPPAWLLAPHLYGAGLIVLFVLAHLAALAAHDLVETRGLASSMISGRKFFTDDELAALGRDPDGRARNTPLPQEDRHG